MKPQLSRTLDLINQYRISDAFDEIDKLNTINTTLEQLRQEFIGGFQNVNYIQRLILAVKTLEKTKENENDEPVIAKSKKLPISLLAFAENGLIEVEKEVNNIYKSIIKSTLVKAQIIQDTTVENLADAMLDYSKELILFHFGGHLEQSHIVMEGLQKMDKIRFTRLLIPDDKHPVPIVFLNGCLSYGHVGILTAKGVKAIIATNAKVNDVEAARVANYFYRWFFEKNAPLRKAFENAEATVFSNSDSYSRGLGTDKKLSNTHNSFIITVNPGEIDDKQPMPASWTLFVNSGHTKVLDWTLQDFVNEFNK